MKRVSTMSDEEKEYATVQIRKPVKQQIVNYCNEHGLKIGRFIENMFGQMISGSAGAGKP
jgi:hypothetical protein